MRVTVVTKLHEAGFPNANIRAVTGHKNDESVERYKRVANEKNMAAASAALADALHCCTPAKSARTADAFQLELEDFDENLVPETPVAVKRTPAIGAPALADSPVNSVVPVNTPSVLTPSSMFQNCSVHYKLLRYTEVINKMAALEHLYGRVTHLLLAGRWRTADVRHAQPIE